VVLVTQKPFRSGLMNGIDILLAEDSPYDAELMLNALKKCQFINNIKVVRDGEEALDFVFASGAYATRDFEVQPKVIFLDIKLPMIDGLEILRRLKSDDKTKSIPVVILTSSEAEKDIKAGYKLGANSYIVKPMDFAFFNDFIYKVAFYWLVLNAHNQPS
jgi:two-component system response regulator